MVDVVKGFLQGQQFQAAQKAQQDSAADAMRRAAMQEQSRLKQMRIDQAIAEGNAAAMLQEGAAGLTAAQAFQGYQQNQQKAAMEQYKNGFLQASSLPKSQRGDAYQFLIGSAVNQGLIPEDMADNLSFTAQDDTDQFVAGMNRLFGIETEEKAAPASGIKNVILPDGSQASFDLTDREERTAYKKSIEGGATPMPSRQEVGQAGDFNITKKEREQLRQAEVATKQAIASANDLLDKIENNPDVLQTVGALARTASGLASEIRGALRAAGVDIGQELMDLGAYEATFEELGIEDQKARGAAFDLALAYAAAGGLGKGKELSNRDIESALRRIGAGGLRSPATRRAVIEDVASVLDRNFRIRYETIRGKPYDGELGLRESSAPRRFDNIPTINTEEEFNKLPSGARFIGPDGQERIKN